MIARWVVHFEWHRGGRLYLSVRRAPRHGDFVLNGGEPCRLERCERCSGDGFLARELGPRRMGTGTLSVVPKGSAS